MSSRQVAEQIEKEKLIAIIRADNADGLVQVARALEAGGCKLIEVTMTTPGALDVVRAAGAKFGDRCVFGAGTILDAETARAAILAGAQFVVCPTLNLGTIQICQRYSVPVMPGAYTPTEILTAWEAGADVVKVFPASVGGPAFIKALKGPLPHIQLAAVGGVNFETTADFFRAGVCVVGVGGELVNQKLLDNREFATITERARKFRGLADEGRSM
jgi:2-dehydro-3-deoxyphosphogluconate aldolase/(4S)-4-hydroxy-2-oxoglutarate aldolase